MKLRSGALGAVLLCLLCAGRAQTQTIGAWVLPQGTARVSAGGEYASFGTLFGAAGRQRIGTALQVPLTAENFAPLRPLDSQLRGFFATTGEPANELIQAGLTLGTPDAAFFVSRVRVPLRLDFSVLPRVQFGVGIPLMRGRHLVQRFGLTDPLLGQNPNPTANSQVLAPLGANAAALGAAALLPVENSPLGQELQRRVREATGGGALQLPATAPSPAVGGSLLGALLVDPFGFEPLESVLGLWQAGDLEVDAAIALIDPFGGRFAPSGGSGVRLRAAVSGGARLATGVDTEIARLVPRDADVGVSGFRYGGAVDLFVGERQWWTVAARQLVLSSTEARRRVLDPAAPLSSIGNPVTLRWNPADTLEVSVAARVRLAEVISFGPEYQFARATGSSFELVAGQPDPLIGPEVMNTPGGVSHTVALAARFTSLIPFAEGRGNLPMDVSFSYRRRIAGPAGAPAEGAFRVEGSVFIAPWGALRDEGVRRPVPEVP